MLIAEAQSVVCENCGAGVLDYALGISALLIALASLVIALKAFRVHKDEADAAAAERARAVDFALDLKVTGARASGNAMGLYFQIGMRNSGDRGAGKTGVNLLLPSQRVRGGVIWNLPGDMGERMDGNHTGELLPDEEGAETIASVYYDREIAEFGTGSQVMKGSFIVTRPMGTTPAESTVVPMRLRVWAPDMRPGLGERVFTRRFRIDWKAGTVQPIDPAGGELPEGPG